MIFDFFKNQKLKEARQEILVLKQEVDVWQDNFRQAMGLVHYYKGYMKKYEQLNTDFNTLFDELHRNEGSRDCGDSRGNQFSDEDLR